MDLMNLMLAKKLSQSGGSGSVAQVQADWNQDDETAIDFIKNKPNIATDEDIMDLLSEIGVIDLVTSSDGSIYTDLNNNIYIL